ncbi:hypothetical protein DFP72DRAFT_913341 [Ephemerocybe angulata]|uniref:DUF6535 domain-containing protein n=1 Tax=Ephemerocybe angulata TaxID=980116 RepID=A0A8H6M2P1_9AGAR|nr:hypothetical protein DFP72DRAFT_913341 [Tulosesus angulatus]
MVNPQRTDSVKYRRLAAMKRTVRANGEAFAKAALYLDALLIFSGIFSVVLAVFLVESHKGLQEDLLLRILQQLRESGSPLEFRQTPITLCVNGLWFTSLVLSLSTALTVLMAKWMGGRAAEMMEVLSILKAIATMGMGISLLLFFAGLIAFTWSGHTATGVAIMVMVSIVYALALLALVHDRWTSVQRIPRDDPLENC